jgi:hypothetical protein
MSFTVANKIPAGIAAVGVAVASEGALPKGISLSRKTLETLGFYWKSWPNLYVPADKVQSPFWLALAKTQN